MSNDKLAEALRQILDATGGYVPNTSKVIWRNAQDALQAHAAEAAQAGRTFSRSTMRCYLGDLTDAEADLAVRAYHLGVVNGHTEPSAEYSDALQLAEEDRVLEGGDSEDELYLPQPAQDAKLPSDEDFRLHLGELTPAELRVAQAAARYVLAGTDARTPDVTDVSFEVWQNDEMVASCSGPEPQALTEAKHYASQYAQDGPVSVFRVSRVRIDTAKESGR